MAAEQKSRSTSRLIPAARVPGEYGIPYTSARDLVFKGLLPVVKIGRAWFFERADIDAFIASNKERRSAA